jgi:hypothetical protein
MKRPEPVPGNGCYAVNQRLEDGWWTLPFTVRELPGYNQGPGHCYHDIVDAWCAAAKQKVRANPYDVTRQAIGKIIHRILDSQKP